MTLHEARHTLEAANPRDAAIRQAIKVVLTAQTEMILEHMMAGRSITPMEALNLYHSERLAARISDIKKRGYIVYTEMVKDSKTGKRYAQYSM